VLVVIIIDHGHAGHKLFWPGQIVFKAFLNALYRLLLFDDLLRGVRFVMTMQMNLRDGTCDVLNQFGSSWIR
jgi:hypothetical protein